MTDTQRPQPQPPAPHRRHHRRPTLGSKPAFWPTVIIAGASFLLLFEFLAFQLVMETILRSGALQARWRPSHRVRSYPPHR